MYKSITAIVLLCTIFWAEAAQPTLTFPLPFAFVDAGAPVGTYVETASTTSGTLSIISGNVAQAFYINETSGEITVLNSEALVYDENPVFSLIVRAADGPDEDLAIITIYLTTLEENLADTRTTHLVGTDKKDRLGFDVSGLGDVNGDGVSDFAIGALTYADSHCWACPSGRAYSVFGRDFSDTEIINVEKIKIPAGFSILGNWTGKESEFLVDGAGDVDGDGFNDILVSFMNDGVDRHRHNSGASFLIRGHESKKLPDYVHLRSEALQLARPQGKGHNMAGIGDVTGDGLDNIAIGSPLIVEVCKFLESDTRELDTVCDPEYHHHVVIRRGDQIIADKHRWEAIPIIPPNHLAKPDKYYLSSTGDDAFGFSIAAAGDVNGDGIGDIIIGAPAANVGGKDTGRVYVVFGRAEVDMKHLHMKDLDGSNGFAISGSMAFDRMGWSVAGAGDINGDGYADVIIGAPGVDVGPLTNAGASCVVFGGPSHPAVVDIRSLDGSNGFAILGASVNDRLGTSVSFAGDMNDDGFDDVIAAASGADGAVVLVFGRRTEQFQFVVEQPNIRYVWATRPAKGIKISYAGDVNSDGYDDFVLGIPYGNPTKGEGYIVYGDTTNNMLAKNLPMRLSGAVEVNDFRDRNIRLPFTTEGFVKTSQAIPFAPDGYDFGAITPLATSLEATNGWLYLEAESLLLDSDLTVDAAVPFDSSTQSPTVGIINVGSTVNIYAIQLDPADESSEVAGAALRFSPCESIVGLITDATSSLPDSNTFLETAHSYSYNAGSLASIGVEAGDVLLWKDEKNLSFRLSSQTCCTDFFRIVTQNVC